jgi:hypothetical protein
VSGPVYDALAAVLDGEPWVTERNPDEGWISIPIEGSRERFVLVVQAIEDHGQLAVYGLVPPEVPEDRRVDAALLVTRINWGLLLGNFELDLDDGEARFKASLDPGGEPVTAALLSPLLLVTIAMLERYTPAFAALIEGADPVAALAVGDA